MKTTTVREVKAKLSEYLQVAQSERVLITSHGAPVAILVGVEGQDMTEVVAQYDERFAASLKAAARGPRTTLEDFRAELGIAAKPTERSLRAPGKRAAKISEKR